MPFKSKKQMGWMFANKPKTAKQWTAEMKPAKPTSLDKYLDEKKEKK